MPDCSPSGRLNAASLAACIPVSVTIELTRRCPLSCLHCYLPETRGRARPGRELSTGQWKTVLRKLARAGGLYLVFTGGEPLLRPDLAELCAYAKELRFDVRLFTSGHGLKPGTAAALAAAGLSAAELSFYGGPAAHDRVTGSRGSYLRTLAAARLLKSAGLKVRMKVPLLAPVSGQARRLKALAEREGFGIAFDPVIAPANDGDRSALSLRPGPAALRAAARASGIPAAAPSAPEPSDFLCGAGRNVCAVDPAGNLYPCLQLPLRLGSLLKRGFRELWRGGRRLRDWRRLSVKDLEGCAGCAAAAFCSRCPGVSLLEKGSALAPNEAACAGAAALRREHSRALAGS